MKWDSVYVCMTTLAQNLAHKEQSVSGEGMERVLREEWQKVKHRGNGPPLRDRKHWASRGGMRGSGEISQMEEWVRCTQWCKKGHLRTRTQHSKGPGGEGMGLATDEASDGS